MPIFASESARYLVTIYAARMLVCRPDVVSSVLNVLTGLYSAAETLSNSIGTGFIDHAESAPAVF